MSAETAIAPTPSSTNTFTGPDYTFTDGTADTDASSYQFAQWTTTN
jgi:hypothetical protein